MSQKIQEIKIIKKEETQKHRDEERRAEIAILEIYIRRYPEKAKEFLSRQTKKIFDKEFCLS